MSLNFCGQCGGRMVEGANPGISTSRKFDEETGERIGKPMIFLRCENDPLRDKYATDNRHSVGYVPPPAAPPTKAIRPAAPQFDPIGATVPATLGRWLRKVTGRE